MSSPVAPRGTDTGENPAAGRGAHIPRPRATHNDSIVVERALDQGQPDLRRRKRQRPRSAWCVCFLRTQQCVMFIVMMPIFVLLCLACCLGWVLSGCRCRLVVVSLRTGFPVFCGEFDPGSGRTLAACLTHARRTLKPQLAVVEEWRTGE